MGKIKMSKTVPAETNHLRGDRESPGDGKNKIRVKVVSKGVLFGMYVACRANVYSKSGNKIT